MNDALVFGLISLGSYRLYRFIALDTWPPIAWARKHAETWLDEVFGEEWADILTCSWCLGSWCCALVVFATAGFVSVPLPVLQWAAASTVVGLIGSNWDGP